MYRYFLSFSHNTNGITGFGNAIFETNVQITDCDSVESAHNWVKKMEEYVENNGHIKNVSIISFCLIG